MKYKVGDRITITKEMVEVLRKKSQGRFSVGDFTAWLGKTGVCYAQRLDREHGQMAIDWGENEKTNIYWLEEIGLEFEKPVFPEQTIMEADEDYLTPSELVVKGLIEEGWCEEHAIDRVKEITEAMAKRGIVFYQP